jgi:predicted transcriptional regulator
MSSRPFLLWGFKSPRDLAGRALGALERRAMDFVWSRGEVTVRDAHAQFGESVAYTTLMTTLDRLFKKGLLHRRKVGRAFAYSAAVTRDELQQAMTTGLLDNLLGGRRPPLPALSSLVDAVGNHDRELLDELERLVQAKRRALEEREPE